ncbi:PAS sensor protein [Candidatus Moduliflexus flocculans]|uniref:histidine kinase n=1 Tax=Candidatus Moduliflexus flocculans TaxID=1499966 RepID=A0A081BN89_9BACT|nr:PAS sensor protein [Candidatus Moduliflexus flocculans]
MSPQHAFHHLYSISRRLTICLVVMAAIVALGTVALLYLKTDAQTEEELRKRADEMTEYLARALEISFWNLDVESMTMISDAFAQNAIVASIVVTDRSGKILYVYQDEPSVAWTERLHPIQHQRQTIGQVRLTFTKQPAQRARYTLLRAMVTTSAMILLVLGGGSGLLVRIFLRKPLQRLNAIVSAYAEGKYTTFEDTPLPYLEFQPFGYVLKRMGVTISEQMKRLQESEERYRKAQAMGHVGNWEYHLQTAHFWGSDEAKRIYGFDPAQSDFSTEAVESCIPERERVHQALIDLIEAEKPYHLEFEIHPRDSSAPRIIVSIAELLRDEQGAPLKVVGVIQDITERKRAEEQIRAHNRLLKEAVQQKQREMEALFERMLRQEKLATIGQISGSIAHELRNSLGAIKQAIYYLKQLARRQQLSAENPKAVRHLDIIETELNTSERVIADLLEISRKKPPKRQFTDLHALLTDVIARCHFPPQIRVAMTMTPASFEIFVDPLKIQQVFLNVLTNAAQAIDGEGAITIHAAQSPESGETTIEIHDTGAGISAEEIQKAFEPLYTTKATGTGLGLPICKEIIESHQGRIMLTSEQGNGATVTIILPNLSSLFNSAA